MCLQIFGFNIYIIKLIVLYFGVNFQFLYIDTCTELLFWLLFPHTFYTALRGCLGVETHFRSGI